MTRRSYPRRVVLRSVVEHQASFDGDFESIRGPSQEVRVGLSGPFEADFVTVFEEGADVVFVEQVEDDVGFTFGKRRLFDDFRAFFARHGFSEHGRQKRQIFAWRLDVQTNESEVRASVRVHVVVERDLVPPEERPIDVGRHGEVGVDVVFTDDRRTTKRSDRERKCQEERGAS